MVSLWLTLWTARIRGAFPPLAATIKPEQVCMMGLRSVDPAERRLLVDLGIRVHDMRSIDENGVAALLRAFLRCGGCGWPAPCQP